MKKAIVVGATSGIGKELAKILAGEGLFWMASATKAAEQIYAAIERKRSHAYITKRWRFVGWLLKGMPDFLYNRL